MRIMIRCDVEGVTGVTHPSQADGVSVGFAYGLAMLHADVNAVVSGLRATGEHDIWIYDMHNDGRNLNMAQLDAGVRVLCGKPPYRPGNIGGLTEDFDGQILLGLHSMAGTGELLAHNYEHEVKHLLLNDVPVGEIGIEAALAGELGVPTILVTGDSAGCAEAHALLGDIPTVSVKESLGPHAGICYPTALTGSWLQDGTRSALESAKSLSPYRVTPPVKLSMILDDGPFSNHVRAKLADAVQPDGALLLTGDSVAAVWQRFLLAKPQFPS